MLFPTSSRRHKGVVLVPQLAQFSAPTAARALADAAAPPRPMPRPLTGRTSASSAEDTSAGAGDEAWAGEEAGSAAAASAASASRRAETARPLLNVGQPEHAVVPPVPSQRPSPGQVPLCVDVPSGLGEAGCERVLALVGIVEEGRDLEVLVGVGVPVRDEGRAMRRDLR